MRFSILITDFNELSEILADILKNFWLLEMTLSKLTVLKDLEKERMYTDSRTVVLPALLDPTIKLRLRDGLNDISSKPRRF